MQVFKDVPTLTARPSEKEMKNIPHRLFGFLEPNDEFSVFEWLKRASFEIKNAFDNGQTPVITGGTGLYIKALTDGLNPMPVIPDEIRFFQRNRMEKIGKDAFLKEYLQKDPDFKFTDPQRILRASEILETSGKTIGYWQKQPQKKFIDADFYTILILPDRKTLYQRCDLRFLEMMKNPVFKEIETLYAKNPSPNALILKALGVRELKAVTDNEISLETAVSLAQQHTRNYAKRQTTWFTRQLNAKKIVSDNNFDDALTNALRFLD